MFKSTREGQMKKNVKRAAAFLSAIVGVSAMAQAQTTPASGFFDWSTQSNPTPNAAFTASPFLFNTPGSAAQVAAVLASAPAGRPLAVKIVEPLSDPAALAIFDNFPVKYVFCDFEDTSNVGRTRAIADQVLSSVKSKQAFVGNFNFYPRSSTDGTRPPVVNSGDPNFYQVRPFSPTQYDDSRGHTATAVGKHMANPQLYSGSPDYRTPGTPDLVIGGTGTPNIRSALFTLPIVRATVTENGLRGDGGRAKGDVFIPWVSRFNNYGNNSLDNDPAPGYQFVADAAHGTANQLPSRGDFQAQILHYRLRGADSVNMFEESAGSVVGDSLPQNRSDVANGWKLSSVANSIFSRPHQLANLTTRVGIGKGNTGGVNPQDGNKGVTEAGALWSGVYDTGGSNRRLAIVLSNLSGSTKTIDLPNMIGGFHTLSGVPNADDDYVLSAGQHRLLTFTLSGGQWRLNSNTVVFNGSDSFGSLTNRNGTGVPEPTTFGLLGIGAIGLLARRRRTA
jgi:hypothetical protein